MFTIVFLLLYFYYCMFTSVCLLLYVHYCIFTIVCLLLYVYYCIFYGDYEPDTTTEDDEQALAQVAHQVARDGAVTAADEAYKVEKKRLYRELSSRANFLGVLGMSQLAC